MNMKNSKMKKYKFRGFTLAETLITLAILGVVAVITIPIVNKGLAERMNSELEANISLRIAHAIENMKAEGKLDKKFTSTEQFVEELQNYLTIIQKCPASSIAECWPTETVRGADGKNFQVSRANTGHNIGLNGNDNNTVGMVLQNGAHVIMALKKDTKPISEGAPSNQTHKQLPAGFGKTRDFAYSTSTVGELVGYIMDVNGNKGPNSETYQNKSYDIRPFEAEKFAKDACIGTEVAGYGCIVNLGGTTAINTCDGSEYKDKYDPQGSNNDYCANNHWAGAKKKCADAGMSLLDKDKLKALYDTHTSGLPTSGWFWSSTEYAANYAIGVAFGFVDVGGYGKSDSRGQVLCQGE